MARSNTKPTDNEHQTDHLDTPEMEALRIDRGLTGFYYVEETPNPGEFRVHSASGHTYRVVLPEMECSCPDSAFLCKHLLRIVAETGSTPMEVGAQETTITFPVTPFAEFEAAVEVVDEDLTATFTETDHDAVVGRLTDTQRLEAIEAVETRLHMSGRFGPDDHTAAQTAVDILRTSTPD